MLLPPRLFTRVLPKVEHEDQLGNVLVLARRLQSVELVDGAVNKLARLYPNSPGLIRHRIVQALNDGNYSVAVDLARAIDFGASASVEVEYYSRVAQHFGGSTGPAYGVFLEDIERAMPEQVDRARLLCAQDALRRGRYSESLTCAALVQPSVDLAPHAVDTALRALERLLLQRNRDGTLVISEQEFVARLAPMVVYLGQNPSDGSNRVDLARLLSVQVSGTVGLSVIAMLTIAAATRPVPGSGLGTIGLNRDISESFKEFSQAAVRALAPSAPFILGVGELPLSVGRSEADAYLPHVTVLIQEAGHLLTDDADVSTLLLILHFGMLLAKHSSTPDEDLVLLRLAGGILAASGRAQQARDIVETALQSATARDSPRRRRLAWTVFADVYHRARNLPEALLGAAVFLSVEGAEMAS